MPRFTRALPFLGLVGVLTVVLRAFPAAQSLVYLLVTLALAMPVLRNLRRMPRELRAPWVMLAVTLGWWIVNNALGVVTGDTAPFGDLLMTIGNLHLLLAAVMLLLRRGRNDVGGMLDLALTAIGAGGLLWTMLLLPRLQHLGVDGGRQAPLLVTIMLLCGVLGATLRLVTTSSGLTPLKLLTAAIGVQLLSNIVLIHQLGSLVAPVGSWFALSYMPSYLFLGLAVLHASAVELCRPGPAPQDRLSAGRLVLIGTVIALGPLVSAIREFAGQPVDGALTVVNSLLVVPLAMVRVGGLARERQRAEAQLRFQATHDLLTGLPNRAELWSRLDTALRREQSASVVVVFWDLNGFKAVNDRLGHLVGDQLLTQVAARVSAGLEPGETLARYAGDEFVLLGNGVEAAERLQRHVIESLSAPFVLAGESVWVGAAVGVAVSDGRISAEELIRSADQDMYRNKQAGQAAGVA
ncbi:diguanylate cyclase domain-containing protein [Actinoplanes sp. GCM10030250]|uniref:diguanylate cyclase domain-containing protein n=1 Tax=Actinoplanes sp. GCM10030250 TaxID=3273376 RepID=UPI00366BAAAD